jgi:NAD(P)-dependent dehydrogenase (short-subunit alcohol dehydrogenase family)
MGLATAKKLQATGHEVIAASRTKDELEKLEIPTQDFNAENVTQLDLPEELDGLAYFPGSIQLKPFHRFSREDFLADFQLNALAAAEVIQQALPSLKKSPSASIFLISTVAVQMGMPFHSSIAMAKGAVEGLIRSLAAELAPKIRVNGIAPSLTDTPLANSLLSSDEKRKAAADRHPLKRISTPEEISTVATYLLSPDSAPLSGQILKLDNGLSTLKLF